MSMRPVPQECDVAIVGAGYAGLAAALTLARAGRHVQVFDRQRPGEGASTRNAGIASGNLVASLGAMIKRVGVERARTFYLEGKQARDDLARFLIDERLECDWQESGVLYAASRPDHLTAQHQQAELLNEHLDIPAVVLDPAATAERLGTERYFGGLLRPDIATLHPAKLHASLLALARGAGATVHGETGVSRIRKGDNGTHELWTLRGPIRARDVIVATNGYTDQVSPWLKKRLVPVPAGLITTAALPPEVMEPILAGGQAVVESRRMYNYFRRSPDGTRLLFGGYVTPDEFGPEAVTQMLGAQMVEVFPSLAQVPVSHAWTGYLAYNRDSLPRLFERDGVRYAAGFCGSGIVWGRWLGMRAAQGVLGNSDAGSAFEFRPPRSIPLYRGRPWFLPAVTAWKKFADRVEQRRGSQ
jgi:glycine/D-amino acid oxidase-like deaminating enzyme